MGTWLEPGATSQEIKKTKLPSSYQTLIRKQIKLLNLETNHQALSAKLAPLVLA